jgi:trimeric autotransporter adhesin
VCVANRCVIAEAGTHDDTSNGNGGDGGDGGGRKPIADFWADRLVAYWPFDGNSLDYSGNRLDFDVSNISFEPGVVGGSLQRTPTSLVKRPVDDEPLGFGVDVFTIQFWLHLDDSTNGVVLSKLDPPALGGWSLDRVNIFDGVQLNLVIFNDGGVKGGGLGPQLLVKTWTHYAIVRLENDRVWMYRNGKLEVEAFVNVVPPTSAPFRVGESISNPSRNLAGKIDELAIWKRSLSATEIAALYNEGKGLTLFAPP